MTSIKISRNEFSLIIRIFYSNHPFVFLLLYLIILSSISTLNAESDAIMRRDTIAETMWMMKRRLFVNRNTHQPRYHPAGRSWRCDSARVSAG